MISLGQFLKDMEKSLQPSTDQQSLYGISAAIAAAGLLLGWLVGGGDGLVIGTLMAFALQWIAFVPASAGQDERAFDAVGASTFLVVMAHSLSQGSGGTRAVLVAALVACWAIRLGTFLFWRTHTRNGDRRFQDIKTNPPHFFLVWTLQGLWVSVTALPAMVIAAATPDTPLGLLDFIGVAMWTVGFGVEVLSDHQKTQFHKNPHNRGRFIQTGFWATSRHPNYLGEMILWCGIATIGLGVFSGTQWLALGAPLFVVWMLRNVSGIPLLEARADREWGELPSYQEYKRTVPVLLPDLNPPPQSLQP